MSCDNAEHCILIDGREPPKVYEETIKKFGIPYKVKPLDVGDYIVGNIIIERKEINDLFNSLHSGRIWEQLYKMKKTEQRCYLLVVGHIPQYDFVSNKSMSKEKYLYLKNSLEAVELRSHLSFNVGFKQVSSMSEFFHTLKNIWNYSGKSKALAPVHKKKEDLFEIKSDIISCIPGFGRLASNYMASKFSIKQLSNMSIDELKEIQINNKRLLTKADKMKWVLET